MEDGFAPRNAGITTPQQDTKELQAIQFILVTARQSPLKHRNTIKRFFLFNYKLYFNLSKPGQFLETG